MGISISNIIRVAFANPPAVTNDAYYLLRERPQDSHNWQDVDGTPEYATYPEALAALHDVRVKLRKTRRTTVAIAALSKTRSQNQRPLILFSRPPWRGDTSILRKLENVLFDAIYDWRVQSGSIPLTFGERNYVVEYYSGNQWAKFEELSDVKSALARASELRKAAGTTEDGEYKHSDRGFSSGVNKFSAFRVKEISSRDSDEAIIANLGKFTSDQSKIMAIPTTVFIIWLFYVFS